MSYRHLTIKALDVLLSESTRRHIDRNGVRIPQSHRGIAFSRFSHSTLTRSLKAAWKPSTNPRSGLRRIIRSIQPGDEFGKALLGSLRQGIEDAVHFIPAALARNGIDSYSRFAQEFPQRGVFPVHKFRSQFDGKWRAGVVNGQDPATDAVPRFKDYGIQAGPCQFVRAAAGPATPAPTTIIALDVNSTA